jgi:hypothetical protein
MRKSCSIDVCVCVCVCVGVGGGVGGGDKSQVGRAPATHGMCGGLSEGKGDMASFILVGEGCKHGSNLHEGGERM